MAELCLREEASLPRNVLSVLVGSLTDEDIINGHAANLEGSS